MNKKTVWIAGIVTMLAVGVVTVSGTFVEVSGETGEKPKAPRYSETCAHGHNGFDCKPPKYKIDISELQEKTSELEQRVAILESQR